MSSIVYEHLMTYTQENSSDLILLICFKGVATWFISNYGFSNPRSSPHTWHNMTWPSILSSSNSLWLLQISVRFSEASFGILWREYDGSIQLGDLLRSDVVADSGGSRSSGTSVFSHRRHQSHSSAPREHLPERLARNALRESLQVL